jgi:hypothetical protein
LLVIPAQAGIHVAFSGTGMDSGLRRNDEAWGSFSESLVKMRALLA